MRKVDGDDKGCRVLWGHRCLEQQRVDFVKACPQLPDKGLRIIQTEECPLFTAIWDRRKEICGAQDIARTTVGGRTRYLRKAVC
jgi:hypothetical protein